MHIATTGCSAAPIWSPLPHLSNPGLCPPRARLSNVSYNLMLFMSGEVVGDCLHAAWPLSKPSNGKDMSKLAMVVLLHNSIAGVSF